MDLDNTNQEIYSCPNCSKEFKTLNLFNRHKKTHNLSCEKCNIVYETFNQLRQHNKEKHPKQKFYKCKVCPDLTFSIEKEYLLHLKNDHEGKIIESHMCNVCGKTFRTSSELTLHIRSKCGTEKQFICKECGQKLMSPGSLYTHLKRHKGENSFMCRFCAKLFLTSGQLKVHERIHTQQKVFICDVCGKGFCHRQSLITHISVHTGIKPYQCEGCGKSFSCVGNLLKHRRTHSDSCGTIPMTSHRVQNPSTKIKVRINTPASSKLKRMQMKKELEQKFATLDKENSDSIKTDGVTNEFEKEQSIDKETYNCTSPSDNESTNDCIKEDADFNEQQPEGNQRKRRSSYVQDEDLKEFIKTRKLRKGSTAICKFCKKEYSNFKWLFKHEQEHTENEVKDEVYQSYKCEFCSKSYETLVELDVHRTSVHLNEQSNSWTNSLHNGLTDTHKQMLFEKYSVPEFVTRFSLQIRDDPVLSNIQKQICCGLAALDKLINKMNDKEDVKYDIKSLLDSANIFADLYYIVAGKDVVNNERT